MSIRIRPAKKNDASVILSFIRELAAYEKLTDEVTAREEDISRSLFCDAPKVFAVIAEEDGAPQGFALYFYTYSTFLGRHGLYLEDLFVRERARGRGLGKALLSHLARIALAEGCGRMEWAVLDWNAPSIAFYESLGAKSQNEWIGYRLTAPEIEHLARWEGT
ncbi:MAG: GNAT family N-acetyltransferase [Pseudomonadota bacterium]